MVKGRPAVTGSEATCSRCGGTTVQGQLVAQKAPSAGAALAFLSHDAAAMMIAAQAGTLVVHAFCLSCGAIWVPSEENLVRAVRGERGEAARVQARQELEDMVKRGSGFRMVSDDDKRMATWARGVLSAADKLPKSKEPQ
jgi:hypothetical protein